MKKLICLITGIVLTVVFFILACIDNPEVNIFDLMYYNPEFGDAVFNNSLYPLVSAIVAIMAWGGAAVYYFVINSVNFDRWFHWASVLAGVTLLTPIVNYFVIEGVLSSEGLDLVGATIQFVLRLMLLVAVLFVAASFSMRWWSSNCRHTPFPQ